MKISEPGMAYFLMSQGGQQNTKTIQVIVIVFGCLSELNGEILKMQYSFAVGEIQLQLTWSFLPAG